MAASQDDNHKRKSSLTSGFSWILLANFTSTAVLGILTLILPALLGRYGNGIWQLYQLYAVYLGYVTFGYTDGIYLRIGGAELQNLNRRRIGGSISVYVLLETFTFVIIGLAALVWAPDNHKFVIIFASAGSIAYVTRTLVSMIFQATGESKSFAISLVSERLVSIVLIMLLLAAGYRDPFLLIIADVIGRYCGLLISFWLIRKNIKLCNLDWKDIFSYFIKDCFDGIYVLFANLCAVLIPGIVRFIAERRWGIEVLGDISIGLQLTSIFMVLINSLSIALFPNIRRLEHKNLRDSYGQLSSKLSIPSALSMLAYLPLAWLLTPLFKNTPQALTSLAVVIPVCIFEAKSRGIGSVYLKALRLERLLLWINLISVVVTALIAAVAAFTLNSIFLALLAVVIGAAIRFIATDAVVSSHLQLSSWKETIRDCLFASLFTTLAYCSFPIVATTLYYLVILCWAIAKLWKANKHRV